MIIVAPRIFYKNFIGMAIYPFILVSHPKYKQDKNVINHEKIHLRQQIEMGILPFYIWYGAEYLIHLLKHKNTDVAYHRISFEREAYANEENLNYLKKRKIWAFLKYL